MFTLSYPSAENRPQWFDLVTFLFCLAYLNRIIIETLIKRLWGQGVD
jgi:hypothetical protein